MTLPEAIKHLEELIESGNLKDCAECEAEHRQLLEWLKDYQSIKEKFKWIPVKVKPTTEDDGIDVNEYPLCLDFQLPDEGERILVSRNGLVDVDANMVDDIGSYLDGCGDWVFVDAWMPLPDPYREGDEE